MLKIMVLGCDAMYSDRWVSTFQRDVAVPVTRVDMEAAASFEMLIPTYQVARC
jgi:hypothetical protein